MSVEWREAFAEASVGFLALEGVANPASHPDLDAHVRGVEALLRARFAGADRAAIAALPEIQAYQRHYRRFDKTYHVLLQIESVALKRRPLASRGGALATAMFAAELQSGLLTAGHDLAVLAPPVTIDCSREGDRFVGIAGQEQSLKPGDMLVRDRLGVISDVLYGPDERTRLRESTTQVLYTTYAPSGVERAAVERHLEALAASVRRFAPAARTLIQTVLPSD